jgi:uncharacterized protein YaiE (UPF0345 family)
MSATITILSNATVSAKANVYFDGKCVSHGVTLADGRKATVGVILPSSLTFNTGEPEVMVCTGGACEVKLPGSAGWQRYTEGQQFSVPGKAAFDIRVAEGEQFHYICHFG